MLKAIAIFEGGGGGGGVTSLNSLTGALSLTSTGNTITITPSGTTINLEAVAGGGTVTSVSGTTNRITSTGGTTPVIDIAATYIGQSSITTLGTIGTGAWQGSIINSTYGGTGVNNAGSTFTMGGNTAFSGAFTFTGTLTGNTAVTFPTSGTLITSATANVISVSNSDGTLTISPTTGVVVASLALGHANSWTGQQTFGTSSPIFSTMTAGSVLFAGTSGLLSQDNANFFWDVANHRLGIGTTGPSARLNLPAGTATASTAPLKFTSGTNLSSIEDGAMEYNGTHLYMSIGSTRYQLDQQSGGGGGGGGLVSAFYLT